MSNVWKAQLENYLDFLQGAKNVSPHTVHNYRRDIEQFLEFLRRLTTGDFTFGAVDAYMARRYLASLVGREYSRKTMARQIAALKSKLQRTNPVEDQLAYNRMFASLVDLEARRKQLVAVATGPSL